MELLKEIVLGILRLGIALVMAMCALTVMFWWGALVLGFLRIIFSKDMEDIIGDIDSKYFTLKYFLLCVTTAIISFIVLYLLYLIVG